MELKRKIDVFAFHSMIHRSLKHLFKQETKIKCVLFELSKPVNLIVNDSPPPTEHFNNTILGDDLFDFFIIAFHSIILCSQTSVHGDPIDKVAVPYMVIALEHRYNITFDQSSSDEQRCKRDDLLVFHFKPETCDDVPCKKRLVEINIERKCKEVDFHHTPESNEKHSNCVYCESLKCCFNCLQYLNE